MLLQFISGRSGALPNMILMDHILTASKILATTTLFPGVIFNIRRNFILSIC